MSDEKKVMVVVGTPSARQLWVRDAFLKAGGEVVPMQYVGIDFGLKPYQQDAVDALNDIATGRMEVSGTLTVFFEDKKILTKLYKPQGHWLSAPRKWKRSQRKLVVAQYGMQPNKKLHSRGWRKHLRKKNRK